MPLMQAPSWHCCSPPHAMHAAPVEPHALMLMPGWHWPLASQQPPQFEALQGDFP
jgi:hypothetical protein